MKTATHNFGTAAATLLVVAGPGAIAAASTPAADGVIHACYRDVGAASRQGSVRIIDSDNACRNDETRITWNQAGPAGPAGPAGAEGPEGERGPAGPSTPPASRLVEAKGSGPQLSASATPLH